MLFRSALLRAVEADPRFIPAIINLGVHEFTLANLAGAERYMRRAIEVDPQEVFAMSWLSFIASWTGRADLVFELMATIRRVTDQTFYVGTVHMERARLLLRRGDTAGARACLGDAAADGVWEQDLLAIQAGLAACENRTEEARQLVARLGAIDGLKASNISLASVAAVRVGDLEAAANFYKRLLMWDLAPTILRINPELHQLLDRAPFAPRQRDVTLVWPLEAPMLEPSVHALFREVRIESGLVPGSGVQ